MKHFALDKLTAKKENRSKRFPSAGYRDFTGLKRGVNEKGLKLNW